MIFKKWENIDVSLTISLAAYLLAISVPQPEGGETHTETSRMKEMKIQKLKFREAELAGNYRKAESYEK